MGFTNFDSPRFLAALDEHIAGGRGHKDTYHATCPQCKRTWEIQGYTEYGSFEATNEEDWTCKDCDIQAE